MQTQVLLRQAVLRCSVALLHLGSRDTLTGLDSVWDADTKSSSDVLYSDG